MGKLTKEAKRELKRELNEVIRKMLLECDPVKFEELKKRYDVLSNMLTADWKVSPDTIVVVAANLLGILLILNHERLDIISTKALGFVIKGRV